jgi:hypothetical protein
LGHFFELCESTSPVFVEDIGLTRREEIVSEILSMLFVKGRVSQMTISEYHKMSDGGIITLQHILKIHKFECTVNIHRYQSYILQPIVHSIEGGLVLEYLLIFHHESTKDLLELLETLSEYPGSDRTVEGVDATVEMLHKLSA